MNYTLNEKMIVYADLDPTEGVLLHLETKHYFKLNETSQVLWKGLQKGLLSAQLLQELIQHFEVSEHDAQLDIEIFIEKLSQEKFLVLEKKNGAFSLQAAKKAKADAN